MEKAKLGIVGIGRLGWEYASNIRRRIPEAELTAVCSIAEKDLGTEK